MSTSVQWRGGTTAEHATFTGAPREVTVDTDKNTLVVHDGATPGGFPMALQGDVALLQGDVALFKASPGHPCFNKTGADSLEIIAGTAISTGGVTVKFEAPTPVNMPDVLTPGEDYAVWLYADGSVHAVADPANAMNPPPAPGAVKFGGFHYGLVASGTTLASGNFATSGVGFHWTQTDVDNIAGINRFSLWDLTFRPTCDPRGMACVQTDDGRPLFWFDLYFCGTTHNLDGTSRYNTDVASGTVPPIIPTLFGGNGSNKYSTFNWYEANEVAQSHGKRLLEYEEFAAAAFGVTENQSLGGASSTIPATARQPGYTSRWGGEQMTGHHYTWGAIAHGTGGSGWVSGPTRGQSYGTPYGARFGGDRYKAASSGSRCSAWNISAWDSFWHLGLRAACDHLHL